MPWIKKKPVEHICPIPFDDRSSFGDIWECDECESQWERVEHHDERLYGYYIRVMHNKYFIRIKLLLPKD
jgi:hypothetical protein